MPSEPSQYFKDIIVAHARTGRVQYLHGDLLSSTDLIRARLDRAVGCFILADKYASDACAADSMSVLRAISVHNFRCDAYSAFLHCDDRAPTFSWFPWLSCLIPY